MLGHEFSGLIVQTGSDVTELKIGDRVAINAVDSCGACPYCIRGYSRAGRAGFIGRIHQPLTWMAIDGCRCWMAALLNSRQCPRRAATFCQPDSLIGMLCWSNLLPSRSLVAELSGLCMLQAVRAAGARHLFVIEHAEAKRRFCGLLGGTFLNSKTDPHFQEEVFDKTSCRGVGVSFECAGAPSALETAVEVTAPSGLICVTGIFPGPFAFDFNPLLAGEKRLRCRWLTETSFPQP